MPFNAEVNKDRIKQIENNGGLAKKTLQRRDNTLDRFKAFSLDYFKNDSAITSFDVVMTNEEKLEDALIGYFESLRVRSANKQEDHPMRNTIDNLKSHLKCAIGIASHGKIDITNSARFPRLAMFYRGLKANLKQVGKGEVSHFRSIDDMSLAKLFKLIGLVYAVFVSRGSPEFHRIRGNLPVSVLTAFPGAKLSKLLQYCVQFIISLWDVRRGLEGLRILKKDAFSKKKDPEI